MTGAAVRREQSSEFDVLRTVRDLIRYAVSQFGQNKLAFGHGSDNAWDEAVFLVLDSLHLPPDQLDPYLDAHVLPGERDCVLARIEQRVQSRKPAAYLTGRAWLYGLPFDCDDRALVPRSLIVEALHTSAADWLAQMNLPPGWPASILDLCCGSASIAVHAAHLFPDARITAADISEPALALAKQNLTLHGLQDQINLVQSDLTEKLDGQHFDLIVCNPPYVPEASMRQLPREYQHEPAMALQAGDDGMQIIERILAQAKNRLATDGLVMIELGHETDAFETRFSQLEFSWLPVSAGEQMIVGITRSQLPELAGQ